MRFDDGGTLLLGSNKRQISLREGLESTRDEALQRQCEAAQERALKEKIQEYASLRDEIKSADQQNFQVMLGVVAGCVALFTSATKEGGPGRHLMLLSVLVVGLVGYRLIYGNRRRTSRIAAYIVQFHELGSGGFRWETRLRCTARHQERLDETDEVRQRSASSGMLGNEALVISSLSILSALYSLLLLPQGEWQKDPRSLTIAVAHLVLAIGLKMWVSSKAHSLRRGGEVERKYEGEWKAVAEGEKMLQSPCSR